MDILKIKIKVGVRIAFSLTRMLLQIRSMSGSTLFSLIHSGVFILYRWLQNIRKFWYTFLRTGRAQKVDFNFDEFYAMGLFCWLLENENLRQVLADRFVENIDIFIKNYTTLSSAFTTGPMTRIWWSISSLFFLHNKYINIYIN